jgi:Protein of unknown function (DUF2500)
MISHNLAFYIFIIMLVLIFIVASLGFLTAMFDNCKIWTYGGVKPIETVEAKVVNKRVKVFHDTQSFGDMIPSYNYATSYYITFEIKGEEKIEFSLTVVEFENINEGDIGMLSYQGCRLLEFEKKGTTLEQK